ncbi:hypothetical protein Q1695_002547 [Nippostrongylus brasiliensis]|nr:hypothetical protein Q1695_002547 [Nippostrongylus brasiliensis]
MVNYRNWDQEMFQAAVDIAQMALAEACGKAVKNRPRRAPSERRNSGVVQQPEEEQVAPARDVVSIVEPLIQNLVSTCDDALTAHLRNLSRTKRQNIVADVQEAVDVAVSALRKAESEPSSLSQALRMSVPHIEPERADPQERCFPDVSPPPEIVVVVDRILEEVLPITSNGHHQCADDLSSLEFRCPGQLHLDGETFECSPIETMNVTNGCELVPDYRPETPYDLARLIAILYQTHLTDDQKLERFYDLGIRVFLYSNFARFFRIVVSSTSHWANVAPGCVIV